MPESNPPLRMLGCSPMLTVADVSATAAWYREMLGFEIVYELPGIWVRLVRQQAELIIEQSDAMQRVGPFEKGGVSFRVEDVDAWSEELQRRGAVFNQGPMNQEYGHRDFSILDPNGYRIGFWEPLE